MLHSTDTTLMGHSTYKPIPDFDIPFPYPDKINYVFSRSKHPDTEHVRFVQQNVAAFTTQLKQQPGQQIWLIGGGQLNTLLLNAGLIDEIILTLLPTLLGGGIPLLAQGAQEQQLQLLGSKCYSNGFVQIRYSINSGS